MKYDEPALQDFATLEEYVNAKWEYDNYNNTTYYEGIE